MITFAGTPDFAAVVLDALLAAGMRPQLVLTQPDRPAGRGRRVRPGPVKARAVAEGIEVMQPERLDRTALDTLLVRPRPDLMLVVAYGLLLPQELLDWPRYGCLNVHASLLPRWRGAAPIQRALLAGDAETGVGIMQMEAGLDTGPLLLEAATPIHADDTGASLHDRLAAMGASLAVEALGRLPGLVPRPQQGEPVYARRIGADDLRLDWRRSAEELERQVRAFAPRPGARTMLEGAVLKLLSASVGAGADAPAGTVLEAGAGLRVACGTGSLWLGTVQPAGGRPMDAASFLRGHPLAPGSRLDA